MSKPKVPVYLEDLRLLSGQGLSTNEDEEHAEDRIPYEAAIARVAAAQLHAIKIALQTQDHDAIHDERGPRGWATDGVLFTTTEAGIALSGIIATLRYLPELVSDLRAAEAREPEAEEEPKGGAQ